MIPLRSPLLRYCLALLLVFAQQQAVVHAVEHDGVRQTVSKNEPGHPAEPCAKCLALAHLHHIGGVAEVRIAVASYTPPRAAEVLAARASADILLGYLSRAPPLFS